jgi:hypothetical protein
MSQCSFTKPNGERCKLAAQGQQGVCWNHDPKNAEQRRRQASKAATAKADKEVREVKKEIVDLIARVRDDGFDPSAANAINRLYQTLLQYIIVERGIYREDHLAQRIKELGEGK